MLNIVLTVWDQHGARVQLQVNLTLCIKSEIDVVTQPLNQMQRQVEHHAQEVECDTLGIWISPIYK